jgi:hypothetical protein
MQLLDDHLWQLFGAGKISAEEVVDKSKNPGAMVDRLQRHGVMIAKKDDALMAEAEEISGTSKPAGANAAGQSEAEKAAAQAAVRARMQAMAAKK